MFVHSYFISIHILLHSFGVLCECVVVVVAALPLHAFVPFCF